MSLVHCYRKAASLLTSTAEPYSVVERVEQHRLHWRPARVHTILLAESHVYTHAYESVAMAGIEHPALANSPTNFVRLVYCLGYGEQDFVGQRLAGKNTGTSQYWKLFASCAHVPTPDAFAPVLKRLSPSFQVRLQAKIDLLVRLRELGVWLLDASILALYSPGGTRLNANTRQRILRCCWEHHVGPAIDEANPHSLIVIGRGVNDALRSELQALSGIEQHTVPQPQARVSAREIGAMHALIHRVCQSAAAARGTNCRLTTTASTGRPASALRSPLSAGVIRTLAISKSERGAMLQVGSAYTRRAIHAEIGGSTQACLLSKNRHVVGVCYVQKMNPDGPKVILVGRGPQKERNAAALATQPEAVPVFVKRTKNEWEYLGLYRGARYEPGTQGEYVAASNRKDVAGILFMNAAN